MRSENEIKYKMLEIANNEDYKKEENLDKQVNILNTMLIKLRILKWVLGKEDV